MGATRQVTVQYFVDCPNWRATADVLEGLAHEFRFSLALQAVETDAEAERIGFRGSPTVLVDGRDPFATGDGPVGLACRIFLTETGLAGAPTEQQLRAILADAEDRGSPVGPTSSAALDAGIT